MKNIHFIIFALFFVYGTTLFSQHKYKLEYDYTYKAWCNGDFSSSFEVTAFFEDGTNTVLLKEGESFSTVRKKGINDLEFTQKVISIVTKHRMNNIRDCGNTRCDRSTTFQFNDSCILDLSSMNKCTNGTSLNISTLKLHYIEPLKNLNPLPREICPVRKTTLKASGCDDQFYSINYSYNNMDWFELIPYGYHGASYDLVYSNFKDIEGKNNLYIRFGYLNSTNQFSDTISYNIFSCSPGLDTVPQVTDTTCSDNRDGGFILDFDRSFVTDESVYPELWMLDIENKWIQQSDPLVKFPIKSSHLVGGNKYNWPYSLASGRYRVRYQSFFKGTSIGIPSSFYEFTIGAPSAITFTLSKTDPKCYSDKGIITIINANGGNGGYSYSLNTVNWVPFSGSNTTISNVNPGKNSVVIKDNKGCVSATKEITIANPPNPITITETMRMTTYFGGNNGFVNVTVNGSNGGYRANWTGPNGYSSSQFNINNLYAGVYTLTITDSKGCSTSKNYTITQPDKLLLHSLSVINIDCNGKTNGAISISGSGGLPNYRFELLKDNGTGMYNTTGDVFNTNTLSDVFKVTDLSKGNYKVRLIDNIGTTNPQIVIESEVIEIKEPNPIEFVITGTTNVLCKGEATGKAAVTITGGWDNYITEWYKDGAILYSTVQNPENLVAGTYILIVKGATINPNSTTCPAITPIAQGEITITEPQEKLEINTTKITSPTASNADGRIVVEATGGVGPYMYVWNTGETSPAITNIPDGIYTITATDANGCIAIKEYIIEELSVTITTTPGEELLCHGNLAGLTANPVGGDKQYTYAWYNQNDLTTVIGTVATIQGLTEGDYVVTVTDTNGEGTLVTSPVYNIVEPALLEYEVVTTPVTCYGGSDGTLTINATGGTGTLQYSIDNGANYQGSNTFTNISGGLYPVLVKDVNNCSTDQKEHLVYAPDPIQIANTVTDVGIYGQNTGAIQLQLSGGNEGFTYSWTGPNGFTATSKDIAKLYTGVYTVVIKDANYNSIADNSGCTTTQTFIIIQPDKLEVTLGYETPNSDLKCHGDDNAKLLATVTGGVEPYTYTWLKETTAGVFTILTDKSSLFLGAAEGMYRVDIIDANTAMVSSDLFYVSQPEDLIVDYDTTPIICFGEATGAINLHISGGTPPYTIVWENGEVVKDLYNLLAGNYTVEVTDKYGCLLRRKIPVAHKYDQLNIKNTMVTDVSVFDGTDGAITIGVEGGLPPYIINWTRVLDNTLIGNTNAITNLKEGNYHVNIVDAEGCSIQQTYTIAEPDIVVATLQDPVCIDDCSGSITIVVDQGNGSFSYLWSTGETTNTITGLCKGTYSVTIEGFGNRILKRTYVLKDPDPLIIELGEDKTLCKDQTYIVDATINDPLATYKWQADNSFTASTAKIEVSKSGTYTVFVTTKNGCVTSKSIQITAVNNTIVSDFIVSSDLFVNENFTIVNLSNPVPDTIEWDIPDTAKIIENTQQYAEIKLEKPGEYKIGLQTYSGDCEEYTVKTIIVRERSLNENKTPGQGLQEYILFPNPTSGNFTVNLTFDKETAIDLKLFNVVNNTMIDHYQDNGATSYNVPFKLEGIISSGIYFLMLETPGKSYIRKIVVE